MMMRLPAVAMLFALFLLTACGGGGAPSALPPVPSGPPTIDVTGTWVGPAGGPKYELSQSDSEVTGAFYRLDLSWYDYQNFPIELFLHKCGALSGKVGGNTLSMTLVMTPQNCPGIPVPGGRVTSRITGKVEGDSFNGRATVTAQGQSETAEIRLTRSQ